MDNIYKDTCVTAFKPVVLFYKWLFFRGNTFGDFFELGPIGQVMLDDDKELFDGRLA